MTSHSIAALFPGQGAQAATMLDGIAHAPHFAERYTLVATALGIDLQAALKQEQAATLLNRNEVSSLLTVLVSTLAYDRWQAQRHTPPTYVAGYSVGQWTALWVAGVLSFADLVTVVLKRAHFMNCAVAAQPGGMIGVVGLRAESIERALAPLQAAGYQVAISNINCLGNYSLAAERAAIEPTLTALAACAPKKVIPLPVAGAWHSALLQPAADEFAAYLADVELAAPRLPVSDHVTGAFLPTEPHALRVQLARHLCAPVLWQQGIERLIAAGCRHFVELGYGRILTQFGFFIDRSCQHETFYA